MAKEVINRFCKTISLMLILAVIGACIFGISAPAKVMAGSKDNLLVNPGAEDGNLNGWVDSSEEKCWMVGYEGSINGWDHPSARSGQYYFMTGWPSEREKNRYLYQDVGLSTYSGGLVTFEGYLGGYGHDDLGGLRLELLDSSGKVIHWAVSDMYELGFGDWSKHVSLSLEMTPETVVARAYLVGALYQGDEADAYFDDLSLTVAEPDPEPPVTVGQVKNLKVTNKKGKRIYVSYNKVTGADGYQARIALKKSMSGAKVGTTKGTKGYFTNAKKKALTFKKGKTYYVQARAYKNTTSGTVYGKWSAIKKVKIKK